jgi:DNA-binding PadR family transcriptional regulator
MVGRRAREIAMTWGHRRFGHHRHRRRWVHDAPRLRLFEAGEARLALLSLLAERPQHGYELMRGLEERSGGLYRASAGTVYPTLQQLADEALVEAEAEGSRRVYRLTDAGRAELDRERDAVERIWRRAERMGDWGSAFDPDLAELVRPALRLLRTVVRTAVRSGDDPETARRIAEILERAAREIRDLRGGAE